MKKTLLALTLTGVLVGCEKQDDPRITNIQSQVTKLDSHIAELQDQVTKLATLTSNQNAAISYIWNQELLTVTNVSDLDSDIYQSRYAFSSAPIAPQDKGYAFLKTPFGNLLVGTENVEPYLDGYKIHLKIGNPTNIRFNGFSLIYSTFSDSNVFATFHAITNNITDDLVPGYWTPIDFVLAPATMEEVRNASVSVELNQLTLLRRPSPSP